MAPEQGSAKDGNPATRIEAAIDEDRRRIAAGNADRTHTFRKSDSGSGQLEVRCPNCHAPTDVALDTALTDLTCSACGSHFSLVDQGQATRLAPSLTKLGRFELVERLGVGGFGTVWKARDKELDRTVAIKIPRQAGMSAEDQEKFFREARAAAQLRHPGIVSVHEVGRDGESIYIVSDFVRGVTLGDWLSGQPVTSRETVELCAKVADALHHAHQQGVVHRDLKPANIMIDGDGQPHLMDFGLARREAGEVTVTMDGQVIGTPAYMSPEQAEGEGHSADRRSDVYSLGVILFQLLTGELPFRGNARMLVHQMIHEPPPSPRKFNSSVPKDLETITLKCLEKAPGRRYPTASELNEELRRFLRGEPIRARPIGRVQRAWRWAKRRPAAAALLAVLAAVAVAGPAVAVQQTLLRVQRDRLSAEREQALQQLDRKNEELQNQLADNFFERASTEFDAGRVPEAIAILAAAHESATHSNPLRETFRNLLAGWSTKAVQPFVHDNSVNAVAFSPDGRIIVTGSDDKTVRLWNRENGVPLGAPLRHPDTVQAAVFTPDGEFVLTGCADATARLWEVARGKLVGKPFNHGAPLSAVAISADGEYAATAGYDGVVKLWTIASRELTGKKFRHADRVSSVAFSPDGERIATGSFDRTARLWNVRTGEAIGDAMQNKGHITGIAFSPDGHTLLTGGFDDSPKFWDARTGELKHSLPRIGWIYSVAFSPDGRLAWVGDVVGEVTAFDVDTKQKVLELQQQGNILSLAVSPDNLFVLSGSSDRTARLVNLQNSAPQEVARNDVHVNRIAFSPDGRRAVSVGKSNVVRSWDLHNSKALGEMPHSEFVEALTFSPTGDTVLTGSRDRKIRIWDAMTGKPLGEPIPCEASVKAIAFDANSQPLLAASGAASALLLDGRTGRRMSELKGAQRFSAATFSSDARVFAAKVSPLRLMFWDVAARKFLGEALQIDENVYSNSFALSPDGKNIAVGGDDESVAVWDVGSRKLVCRLNHAGPIVYSVAYSPDGSRLVTGSETRGARLWDARTGKPMGDPIRLSHWITAVAFSPDGQTVLAGCEDGRLWQWYAPPPPLADNNSLVAAWAKARTAMSLNDQRTPRRLDQKEWLKAQASFRSHSGLPTAWAEPDALESGTLEEERPAYIKPPMPTLRGKLGQKATVELEVARVDQLGSGVVLMRSVGDISRPDCFDVMMPEPQLAHLKPFGIDFPDELVGKRIRVTGKLEEYSGHVELRIGNILTQLQIRTPEGNWEPGDKQAHELAEFIEPPVSRLRELVGNKETVEFRVQHTGGRTRLYLNSRDDYQDRDCFIAVVSPDQVPAFAALGVNTPGSELLGKLVRVTGTVEENAERGGQIQIHITDLAAQLKILEKQAPKEGLGP